LRKTTNTAMETFLRTAVRKSGMGVVDILRKLGIFRSGTEKQVYHSGTERSGALQNDGVFDEQKDFVVNKTSKKNPKK